METPKKIMRAAAEYAAAEKARKAKAAERRGSSPYDEKEPADEPESEAALWVKHNFKWMPYAKLWVPSYCSWSAHSGSYTERSNCKYLLDNYPELFKQSFSGMGTVHVGMSNEMRLRLEDEQWETIKDLIEGLQENPSLDVDQEYVMENEGRWDYWAEYGRDAVREALVSKYSRDVNAQIAVLVRPNAFWDKLFEEYSFADHMAFEDGIHWYFNEKDALEDVNKYEIVGDVPIENTKIEVFFRKIAGASSYAQDLEEALKQVDVVVDNDADLWRMLVYAERVLGSCEVWEVGERFHTAKQEVDPFDYLSLENISEIAEVLRDPSIEHRIKRLAMLNDPAQTILPGFESKAQVLARTLLEAESPKAFLKSLSAGVSPKYWQLHMPKKVEIYGKRWFSRTYGTTYCAANIYVDGQFVHRVPMHYGYGDHYADLAFDWLEANGYVPPRPAESRTPAWMWADECGFQYLRRAEDVRRQRDLA